MHTLIEHTSATTDPTLEPVQPVTPVATDRQKKILVATPAHAGTVFDNYLRSIILLTGDAINRGIQVDVMTISGESLINRARNNFISHFLGGDWTHLFFIDGDIGFDVEAFWRLVDSQWDVACGTYPLKKLAWDAMAGAQSAEQAKQASRVEVTNFATGATVQPDGFIPVVDAGTGFMCISRGAIYALANHYDDLLYKDENTGGGRIALFDTMVHDGRYLSEDYAFCRRWQMLGGVVMVDTLGPKLTHRGLYEYGA